jgi:predicted RNA-binding Zn ribbon-like protein
MTHSDEKAAPERFELSGGALCLDFANTWGNQADPGSDRLRDYEHLVAFARQTGSLTDDAAATLSRTAGRDREASAAALSLGRELRQVIYRVFSSRAGHRDVQPENVDRINAVLGEALSHRRIEQRDGGFAWNWTGIDAGDLRSPVWPIIESAAALLASEELNRVRECNAPDCNWLFLDRSRSGTRRWCSMQSCGNRAKARRHYRRREKGRARRA